jgi:ABC-type transport system involved in cytochrome c biogenesis permease component
MNLPPVLDRELRVAGRNWSTYWLRVLAGFLMALFLTGIGVGELLRWGGGGGIPTTWMGGVLLGAFHAGLTGVFVVVCPVVTADCLARERREGTLGLLFLTPLSAGEVVMGKTVAHVLRALALWLSVVPFLAIPFLMGGVAPGDFGRAVGSQAVAMLTGLAAGFLATRHAVRWTAAVGWAFVWALGLWVAQGLVSATAFNLSLVLSGNPALDEEAWFLVMPGVLVASHLRSLARGAMGFIPGHILAAADAAMVAMLAMGALVFAGSVVWAAVSLKRQQRQSPESARSSADPKSVRAGKPWRRRRLRSGNPVVWLELRGTSAAVAMWGGLGLVMGSWLLVLLFRRQARELEFIPMLIPGFLLLIMALAAAGSFRQEVEEGTMEILLVTGLSPAQLVAGRCWALWRMFGPAVVGAVLATSLMGKNWHGDDLYPWHVLCLSTLLTLPAVGMRSAMRRLAPLLGWMVTLGWGVVVPLAVGGFLTSWFDMMGFVRANDLFFAMWVCAVQIVAALWWGKMTVWDLRTRNYRKRPLQRADG